MAVVNTYIDPNLAAHQKQDPNKAGGSRALITVQSFAIGATDSATSTYRIGRIASNAVPFTCVIGCTALTSGTSYDLGVYVADLNGAAVDANLFMSAQTLASASKTIDGISALTVAQAGLRVWELLGLSADPQVNYDLVLTANTPSTAAGNVSIKFLTAQY